MTDAAREPYVRRLPIVVISPHSRCNCRCVMCDIWRIRKTREITARDLEPHLSAFRELGVRWVVFSGGEPLMHSDLWSLTALCRPLGIRATMLTAGTLLERGAAETAAAFDDLIVSLDGPAEVHDRIRGVSGTFARLRRGIEAVRGHKPGMPVHGRCTVQRANRSELRGAVRAARDLGLDSISFLAADVLSSAFNREEPWSAERRREVAMDAPAIADLERELDALERECRGGIGEGFIRESPAKLRGICGYYRSLLGIGEARSPRCNAPWVSAVIESGGDVRPCFFHPPLGNIHDASFADIVNGEPARAFRARLDVASNPTCRSCVCSLFWKDDPGPGPRMTPENPVA